jgi:ferredoxin
VNPAQAIYQSKALPQTARVMVKDEDVCLHCGLCAERCPTAAWDMRTFELLLPYAGGRRSLPVATAPVGGGYAPPAAGVRVSS